MSAVSGRGGTGDEGFRRVKRLGLESRPGELRLGGVSANGRWRAAGRKCAGVGVAALVVPVVVLGNRRNPLPVVLEAARCRCLGPVSYTHLRAHETVLDL